MKSFPMLLSIPFKAHVTWRSRSFRDELTYVSLHSAIPWCTDDHACLLKAIQAPFFLLGKRRAHGIFSGPHPNMLCRADLSVRKKSFLGAWISIPFLQVTLCHFPNTLQNGPPERDARPVLQCPVMLAAALRGTEPAPLSAWTNSSSPQALCQGSRPTK